MKYIDADKLRSVLQNTINSMKEKDVKGERYDAFLNGKLSICEELLGCIDSLQQEQPSLPSNLDEAAKECAIREGYLAGLHHEIMKRVFKAGAEWMAGQGVSVDGKVIMNFSEPYDIINRKLIAKLGDALLKVEPGEVIVQIRKKQ